MIHHHTDIILIDCSPHTVTHLFCTGSLYLLTCLSDFPHPSYPLPSGTHQFVLCICEFASVLFVQLKKNLLEYSLFTGFQVYSQVNLLYVHIYPLSFDSFYI